MHFKTLSSKDICKFQKPGDNSTSYPASLRYASVNHVHSSFLDTIAKMPREYELMASVELMSFI